MLCPVFNVTKCHQWHKVDPVGNVGSILRVYEERTVHISLPERHPIIIFYIQIFCSHLADLHFKITVQTHRRDEQLEGRTLVGHNKKISNTFKSTILFSH